MHAYANFLCPHTRIIFRQLRVSDSKGETGEVNLVRVADQGIIPQGANVFLQVVPAVGVGDSGMDITIVGGKLFK